MVLSFLRSDFGAPRPEPRKCLLNLLGERAAELILRADLDDASGNAIRKQALLSCRVEQRDFYAVVSTDRTLLGSNLAAQRR